MKFLPTEHQSVKAVIETAGLTYADFSFVKKKGRLNIEYKNQTPAFTFFRRKETQLDSNLKWTEHLEYELTYPKSHKVNSWEEVLLSLESWLREFKE